MLRHRWRRFGVLDTPAMEYYFEKMAARGWMLKDGYEGRWIFEKTTPRDIRFSVAILGDVSLWEKSDNEQSEEFRFYCESAGWHFLFADRSMQILWSENKDILPIETDERLKFEMARKQYVKMAVLSLVISIVCPLIIFLPISLTGFGFIRFLIMNMFMSNAGIALFAIVVSSMILSLGNVAAYRVWCILSAKRLEKGEKVWYCKYPLFCIKEAGMRLYLLFLYLLLYWFVVRDQIAEGNWPGLMRSIIYFMGITACSAIGVRARKRGFRWYHILSGAAVIALMIFGGIYSDRENTAVEEKEAAWMTDNGPLLSPEDLQLSGKEWVRGYNTRHTSILLDQEYYSCWIGDGSRTDFSYTLYQSDYGKILNWIKKDTDKNKYYRKAGDWWDDNIHVYAYFYTDTEEKYTTGIPLPEEDIPRSFCSRMILKNGPYMLKVDYKITDRSLSPETIANLAANKMRTLPGIL